MSGPLATYRLQLDPAQLDFAGAARLVPYLKRLGISHLYLSPITAARPGSPHGYDVVDPDRVNPELGGESGLRSLVSAARAEGLGVVVDMVPNHMAIGRHNRWWMEVLRHGPTAPHSRHFDLFCGEDDRLLLPLLGRPYAEALAEGELAARLEGDQILIAYWEERFPVDPATYPLLLEGIGDLDEVLEAADAVVATEGEERVKRSGVVDRLLAETGEGTRERVAERLAALEPDRLHALLEAQHYRLVWWQYSRERLGHRRFFTITELAGIRQEDPAVFRDTHRLVTELVADDVIDGVRIDHVDGLRDPEEYLARLRDLIGEGRWLVVEKILSEGETLPDPWPVQGTTGYEYIDTSGKLFVSPAGLENLASFYRRSTGEGGSFADVVHDQQRFIILERLAPEARRFSDALEALAREDRWARDVIPSELIDAAVELVACLPVYRTYVRDGEIPERDRPYVEEALEEVTRRRPDLDRRAVTFLRRVFLLDHTADLDTADRRARSELVERVQQFTGAVTAKGVEDTAFYQHNTLISLNEVGSHPEPFPQDPVASYHEHNQWVATHLPATMTSATTHDTKRSEDVRSRIGALSQVSESWLEQVEAWHSRNRRHRGSAEAGAVPTRNEELFIYQTLVGSWPLDEAGMADYPDRLEEHLIKAAREAKVHTEWLEPDLRHEEALVGFVRGVVGDEEFVADLHRFADPVWRAGAGDSLAQLLLRLAAPGVPDIYRGCELWDLSLTDPDNRRPVDWERRQVLLDQLEGRPVGPGLVEELARTWEDGRIKLFVTQRALATRAALPEVFDGGSYLPLEVEGERAEHVVGFARQHRHDWVLAVVPRLVLPLLGEEGLWPRSGWEGTTVSLPEESPRRWVSVLTGEEIGADGSIPVSALLGRSPVALLRGS